MRILLASDHYPPLIGGAQVQTRLLATSLFERGRTVAVATTWHYPLPSVDDSEGFPVHRVRQVTSCVPARLQRDVHHHPPFPDPVTVAALRRLIKRFKPDVVHSHGWFTYSCAAALLGSDIPLVASARDYGYSCATRTMLELRAAPCSGPATAKCLRCATEYYGLQKGWAATLAVRVWAPLIRHKIAGVHSVSRYVQEVVRRDFLGEPTPGNARVVEDVIPELVAPWPGSEALASGPRERLRELPRDGFILFVGALRREKGVDELLDAYRRLRSPPPLVLVGTIQPETPETLPEGVTIVRDLPHSAIASVWERALFGVAPSVLPEPLGTVVCEALSCGRAVIGTDHGGHPDVITPGVNGLLVSPGDPVALADAMQSLLDDPALRERLTAGAVTVGHRFAADRAIERFEHLYAAAIAKKQADSDGGQASPQDGFAARHPGHGLHDALTPGHRRAAE